MASIIDSAWQFLQDLSIALDDAIFVILVSAALFPVAYVTWRVLQFIISLRYLQSRLRQFPSEPRTWSRGNLHLHPGPNHGICEFLNNLVKKHKRAMVFWYGPFNPTLICFHPDTVKPILRTSEPKNDGAFSGSYRFAIPWLGYGLLLSRGKQWARNRKLLTPAFHYDVLKPYMNIYNEAADILISKFESALLESSGGSVEVFDAVSLCTLDIILRCAFSFEDNVQQQGTPYTYFDRIFKRTSFGKQFHKNCDHVHALAENLIQKRQKTLKSGKPTSDDEKKHCLDFLDILLLAKDDQGEGLTNLEIRQEVDTFLFEGHDTTASAISWCLHALAGHPVFQTKAREEVQRVVNGRKYLEWDDMGKLPYLTMCIKESLRLVPPVLLAMRQLTTTIEIDGIQVPPGTMVEVNLWALHHNELIWGTDHMEFKPERFLHENMKDKDSYAYCPFSAGPRNCIGQVFAMHEVKTVVARMLLQFDMKLDPNHVTKKRPELIIRTEDGMHLILSPRH